MNSEVLGDKNILYTTDTNQYGITSTTSGV
jgi:hypothetical protein